MRNQNSFNNMLWERPLSARILRAMVLSTLTCVTAIALFAQISSGQSPGSTGSNGYRISGPYTHENLTIYLIHRKDQPKDRKLLTLAEALKQQKVRVQETSNVNQLLVENLSDDEVFIHSGDIVKGGKQDRTFPEDCILPARSAKIPVAAFCVEQGRWRQRGTEEATYFATSSAQLASKDLKLAAKHEHAQAKVWEAVQDVQGNLGGVLRAPVTAAASSTSLQLSLENRTLKEQTKPYLQELLPLGEGNDLVGYAFAINGEINSADVYSSSALFHKLWPTLLESSAVEAISKRSRSSQVKTPPLEAVKGFLADAEAGRASSKEVGPRTELVTRETQTNLLFETRDRKEANVWIHRNYLTKSREPR